MSLLRKTRIKVPKDLASISRTAAECDPRDVQMTQVGVDAIWAAVEELFRTGLEPAIGLCIRRHGQVVMDRTIGYARGVGPGESRKAEKVVLEPDTPFCIFSASKAMTAMVIHMLDDRGLLHIDDRVGEYIPEFACHGKDRMTIRHVLTHRAGIPLVPSEHRDARLFTDWDRIVGLLCESKPQSIPGRRLAYHAITGGFVLGEIVRRVTGKSIREFMRTELLEPLGFEYMNYGVPEKDVHRVVKGYSTGSTPLPLRPLIKRALGVSAEEAVDISNSHAFLTQIVPAGNICASANETSRYYQLLLNEGELDGVRIFSPRTIHRAVNESAFLELDLTIGLPIHYGNGLMLGGKTFSLYGPDTPHAYGHLGFTQMITWADPERQTACALLTSGKPFVGRHLVPIWHVLSAISEHCTKVVRA